MSNNNTDISKEEALELQRFRIRQEMQEEITSWAKKRFAMLGMVIAVIGFFGLSTVLQQSLQTLVTKPVDRELAKLDTAREEAAKVVEELRHISAQVEKTGQQAEAAAGEAATAAENAADKIKELDAGITDSNRRIAEIKGAFKGLQDSMRLVSGNVFDLASVSSDKETRLAAEILKANRMLGAMERLISTIAESFKTTQVEVALKQFSSDINAINADYVSEYNRINKIRTFNIVYYVDPTQDNTVAQATVEALKRAGYRAAVWFAQGKTRDAVIKEIAAEFGDISDILETNFKGMVAHPAHEDIARNVEELLSTTREMKDLASIRRPLRPTAIHLSSGRDKMPFEADRVILIYSIGDSGT